MKDSVWVRGLEYELVRAGEIDAVADPELDSEAATAAMARRARDFIAEAEPRVGDVILLLRPTRPKRPVAAGGGCSTG